MLDGVRHNKSTQEMFLLASQLKMNISLARTSRRGHELSKCRIRLVNTALGMLHSAPPAPPRHFGGDIELQGIHSMLWMVQNAREAPGFRNILA
jgi:hypothetical protein